MQGGGAGEAGPEQVQHHLAAGQPAGADPPDRAVPVQQQVTQSPDYQVITMTLQTGQPAPGDGVPGESVHPESVRECDNQSA